MGSAAQLVFPSAIIGSAILTVFAFLTTSGLSLPQVAVSTSNPVMPTPQPTAMIETPSVPQAVPTVAPAAGQESGSQEVAQEVVEQAEPQPVVQSEPEDELEEESRDNCKVSKKYPGKIRQWCDLITKFSRQNDLDPDLIAALIWQESGGNPVAYSKSGAVGLMQVMPRDGLAASFMCVNGPCFTNRPSIAELEDPAFNVKYGTGMLANLVAKYGDVREALRYYGPRDVGYYYADKVLGIHTSYRK
jgi:hypothetical protein